MFDGAHEALQQDAPVKIQKANSDLGLFTGNLKVPSHWAVTVGDQLIIDSAF